MEDSGPLTRLCPRCGVAVSSGYVKCPRCHGELPLPVQSRARRRQATDGGGTAVEPGANRMFLYLGAAGVAVIALIAWLALRGGSTPAATVTPDAAVEEELGAEPEPGPGEPTQRVERPPPTTVPSGNDGAAAVASLGRALRAERLWSGVAADGDVVTIDSSFCDDAGLTAIVDAAIGELRAAKFRAVRCRAPHGAIMFDRSL